MKNTDRDILNNAYKTLITEINSSGEIKHVEKKINDANISCQTLLVYLSNADRLPKSNLRNYLLEAKQLLVRMVKLSKKSEVKASKKLMDKAINSLADAISKCEVNFIEIVRMQEDFGERINLQILFNEKRFRTLLKIKIADDVIRDKIRGVTVSSGTTNNTDVFVTITGKHYHLNDCPYCKSTDKYRCTRGLADLLMLSACKCVSGSISNAKALSDQMTVFIDESIHTSPLSGKYTGNYSYIICKGLLTDESMINKKNVLKYGVDAISDTTGSTYVTKNAISKVMLMIYTELNYTDNLTIYSDNATAISSLFDNKGVVKRLSSHFKNVTVSYIPREGNTMADALTNDIVMVSLSASEYRRFLKFCNKENENASFVNVG